MIKKIIIGMLVSLLLPAMALAGPGDWIWMSGSNTVSQTGIYGSRDVPDAANVPGARSVGITWTDYTGNLWGYETSAQGSIQINKCTVKAGTTDNSDSITFSGLLDASEADLDAAQEIIVTIEAKNIPDPGVITFTLPISGDSVSKGKYKSPKDTTDPVVKLQIDTNKGTMKFSAKNADLTGLSCPMTVRIKIGDYFADTVLDEDIINGKKPCPSL
jgi:hypothetical protein